ncbi:MerR family transcriptional regulator [Epibacterium ulvae]|uniref:MerR family transcriptional regulator n=1 Tax=Epibacterium ulvae TaxID=1156985 RepID=UPI001BFC1189|nr:MerR family transcriptional regulator [Epibacterium ulvae]
MKISEAAAQSGLSVDTIRFYERAGLLPRLHRGADGHRVFTPTDLRWLRMFERLRATHMPLKVIQSYVELSREPDSALERRAILEAHRAELDTQQAQIDACRELLDEKIRHYDGLTTLAKPPKKAG